MVPELTCSNIHCGFLRSTVQSSTADNGQYLGFWLRTPQRTLGKYQPFSLHSSFSPLSPWQLNELQKSQNQDQNSPGNKSTFIGKEESRDQPRSDDGGSERLSSLQAAHDALRLPVEHVTQNISAGVIFIKTIRHSPERCVTLFELVCFYITACVSVSRRSELVSERERTAALQATLSLRVQEKLTAERKLEALELEKQSVSDHLKRYQEQNSVKEDLFSRQKPEQPPPLSSSPEGNTNLYNNQVKGTTCHL